MVARAARFLAPQGEFSVEAGKVAFADFEGLAQPRQLRLSVPDFGGQPLPLGLLLGGLHAADFVPVRTAADSMKLITSASSKRTTRSLILRRVMCPASAQRNKVRLEMPTRSAS